MTPDEPTPSLDLRGRTITTYIAHEIAAHLADHPVGASVEVVTDPFASIEPDLAAWGRMTGHTAELVERSTDQHRYLVTRGEPRRPGRSLAVVVSEAGLEELLSPLGFALAGALAGMDTAVYVQGPAVRILTDDFTPHLPGVGRPFSTLARRGMEQAGHIAPQDKLGQLHELGARLYACGPSMEHFGVDPDELIVPDVTVCEYLTFIEVLAEADVQLYP